MTDDDDLPPVISLADHRAKVEIEPTRLRARIEGDQLQLYVRGLWVGLGRDGTKWLKQWCAKFEADQYWTHQREEHRCGVCGFVEGIECRGHRSREQRVHYQIEILERGVQYVSRSLLQAKANAEPERKEYTRRARAACRREVGSHVTSSWDKVTCAGCLKRKPRVVP